ncbi:Transcription initiation factor TFIID subunit 11 [Fusarium oxysporum f. sp. albedinis]|nr:Transcription initiation factor TFIID subunit 11 [Fusarium oxysporum f. sp. albedinis]
MVDFASQVWISAVLAQLIPKGLPVGYATSFISIYVSVFNRASLKLRSLFHYAADHDSTAPRALQLKFPDQ